MTRREFTLFALMSFGSVAWSLPSSFDVRSATPINPIKDQTPLPVVVAFAAIDAMEINLAYQNEGLVRLSEAFLTTCDTVDFPDPGCGGGDFPTTFAEEKGFVKASDFPVGTAATKCASAPVYKKASSAGYLTGDVTVPPTTDQLKGAILTHGVVSVAIEVDGNLSAYAGGVFSTCDTSSSGAVNHAVNLIGWNDDGQYWIARNSWGEKWGEQGYLRIKYGCNHVGEMAYVVEAGN